LIASTTALSHIVYLLFYFSQLTLSVCVWRWSCDSLHGSICWNRWSWGCL